MRFPELIANYKSVFSVNLQANVKQNVISADYCKFNTFHEMCLNPILWFRHCRTVTVV
jgi:hypothetical protein